MAEYFQSFVYMSDIEPIFNMFSISDINQWLKVSCLTWQSNRKPIWKSKLLRQFLKSQKVWNDKVVFGVIINTTAQLNSLSLLLET